MEELPARREEKQTELTQNHYERYVDLTKMQGKSMGVFSPEHNFRSRIQRITVHSTFINFIDIAIVVSAGTLSLEDKYTELGKNPLDPRYDPTQAGKYKMLVAFDWILTTIFFIEMMFKIISFGFWKK